MTVAFISTKEIQRSESVEFTGLIDTVKDFALSTFFRLKETIAQTVAELIAPRLKNHLTFAFGKYAAELLLNMVWKDTYFGTKIG